MNTLVPSTSSAAAPQILTTSTTDPSTTATTVVTPASSSDGNGPTTTGTAVASTLPANVTTLPAQGFTIDGGPLQSPGILLANGLLGGSDDGLGLISGGFDAFSAFGGSFIVPKDAAQAPTSSGDSTTTTDPLQADFQKLDTDLQAITDKSQVTPAMLGTVRKDFEAIQAAATTAPDQTKLQALATDVSNLKGTLPTADQTTQLETDFTAVLNSEGVTDQGLISQAIADVHAVIQATNITSDDLAKLAADRQAIQNDSPAGATDPIMFSASQNGGPADASFSTAPVAVSAMNDGSAPTSVPIATTGGPSIGSFSDYSRGSAGVLSVGNFMSPAGANGSFGRFAPGSFSIGGQTRVGNNNAIAVSSSGTDANGGFWYGNVQNGPNGGNGPSGRFMMARMNGRLGF